MNNDINKSSILAPLPTGEAATCFTFINVPTVPLPSSKYGCTLSHAVFSINAIIAGVANTSRAPLPITFAVFSSVTIISCVPFTPSFNICNTPFLILH